MRTYGVYTLGVFHFRSQVAFEQVAWLRMKAMRKELRNGGGLEWRFVVDERGLVVRDVMANGLMGIM